MLTMHLDRPADKPFQILCLGAHSDDIEIGCGGTVLSLLRQHPNVAVRWVVFSSTEERASEAKSSAAAFLQQASRQAVSVLNYRDGFFPSDNERIKLEFEILKRDFTPDLVFTHYRDDRHQDHRVVSDLTWNTFRNHLVLEYEIPKYDGDLGRPNFFVPIEDSIRREKIGRLLEHFPTQRQKQWFDEETFSALLRLRGMEANSPTRYAEAFYSRKSVLGGFALPAKDE